MLKQTNKTPKPNKTPQKMDIGISGIKLMIFIGE